MEVITPTYLSKDWAASTEEGRQKLICELVRMAGEGRAVSEVCEWAKQGGWGEEFVRWLYIRARAEGEFRLVGPLETRVRQHVRSARYFKTYPGYVKYGSLGLLLGILASFHFFPNFLPGLLSVVFILLVFFFLLPSLQRPSSSKGRWIDPK